MLSGPLALFVVVGGALAVGYAGHRFFRRYHVSDIVFLLLAGLIAGPILGLVDSAILAPAMPFLAPLALMVVLFEGGLDLAWADIKAHAARGVTLALCVWTLTTVTVATVGVAFLGFSPMVAVLFGFCVAATGMLVVIPLLAHVRAPPEARVILTLETSLGDLLSAVVVTTLSSILVLGGSPAMGVGLLTTKFFIGASAGILAGVLWARWLHVFAPSNHGYPVTLAALILAYAAAEALGGSGYLCALAFGLFVGNAPALMRRGGIANLAPLQPMMRAHQSEVIFLLRAVFFVYLGLTVPASTLTPRFAFVAVALLAAMVIARYVGVLLSGPKDPSTRVLLVSMMPRGLATAVIAAIPVAMGVPGTADFLAYTFAVIVAADLATSVGLAIYKWRTPPVAPDAVAAAH